MFFICIFLVGFPGGSDSKELACNAEDLGSIPGLGRSPGEGNDYPLQYSCLENPIDRGAWQAVVLGVTQSWTRLRDGAHTSMSDSGSQLLESENPDVQRRHFTG